MLDETYLPDDSEMQDEFLSLGTPEEQKLNRLLKLVSTIRACHVDFTHLREIRADFRNLLLRDNSSSEGSVIAVFGASRSGKSKLLLDFQQECDAIDERLGKITLANGDWARRRSFVQVNVPDSSMKTLMQRLHGELNDKQTLLDRRFDYEEEIDYLCSERRVRVLGFDEVHQGIAKSKSRATSAWQIAQKIKDLSNRGDRSIILSGTEEAEELLFANKELAGRCHVIYRLAPLDWKKPQDRLECKTLLNVLDKKLHDIIFPKLSGLAETGLARRIHIAADGTIGHIATLVEIAAKKAVYDLVSGQTDCVLMRHFEAAFENWATGSKRQNPFSGKKAVAVPSVASIKPSSRKAGRDQNYRP